MEQQEGLLSLAVQLVSLTAMTISAYLLAHNQLLRLSKKELRARQRNRGIGSGRAERAAQNSVEAEDCVSKWRMLPRSLFLFQIGFYPEDFDQIVAECKDAVLERRCSRDPDKELSAKTKPGRPRKLSVENEIAMCLYWLKHGCQMRALTCIFGYNQPYESIHHTVLAMLSVLGPKDLRFPTLAEQKQLLELGLYAPYSQAIGSIDGTYTESTRATHCCSGHRKAFVRSAQCAINSLGYFILVLSGICGGVHDSAAYELTALFKGELELDSDCYLLSDNAYKKFPDLNPPVDDGVDRNSAVVKQTFTNWRTRIEHSFSRLKAHFLICDKKWVAPAGPRLQAEVFMLACALYNRKLDANMFKAY
jgi:hypothetical protein